MQFLQFEFDALEGQVVRVALRGNAANVRLMDEHNFRCFRNRQRHHYYGGYFKQSPAVIKVPHCGRWFVTVDLGGGSGHVEASLAVASSAATISM